MPKSATEDSRRQEFILNVILAGLIAITLALDVIVAVNSWRWGDQYVGVSFGHFSAFAGVFIALFGLSRQGWFRLVSLLLVTAAFAGAAYSAYTWGADLPSALLGFALAGVIASVLVGTRFGFFVTGAAIIALAGFGHRNIGATPLPESYWRPEPMETNDVVEYALVLGFVGIVSWLSNHEIEKSLTRARRSEVELQNVNARLETRVRERTQELQNAQAENLADVYRFAEFGKLASGLFHDLINMITVLAVRVEHDAVRPHETKTSMDDAIAVSRRAERYLQSIRKQLNRQSTAELFWLDESIDDAIRLLTYKAQQQNVNITHTGKRIKHFGDPFAFHQIIMNLISNAIDAFETVVTSGTREAVIDVAQRDGKAIITVTDNGPGMLPDIADQIFEPFFTTKEDAQHAGIGLATVKRVIEGEFRGSIVCTTRLGKGSVFTVTFPLFREPPSRTETDNPRS